MKNVSLKNFLISNSLQITLQIVGVLVVIFNLFIATKLFPLSQSITLIKTKVEAVETRNERVDPLVERFLQLEERDKQMVDDIKEMKTDIKVIRETLVGR